ncbi:hypothetical protein IV203_032411 [Nitzschia inconspicua]|uniref:Uncharacterized protein n=1 Tax=Nitzschia inconspicua TaxID=303405 RepID=A0A9K3KKM8_9STRA|nr:hypothetical protein IV203_032411 [Nitzschia inconspicua]
MVSHWSAGKYNFGGNRLYAIPQGNISASIKWRNIKARQLLYPDIMDGNVALEEADETKSLEAIFSMHIEYAEYGGKIFKGGIRDKCGKDGDTLERNMSISVANPISTIVVTHEKLNDLMKSFHSVDYRFCHPLERLKLVFEAIIY